MKKTIAILICAVLFIQVKAQTFMTRNGSVSFYSKTPLEDIKADNRQVYAIVDAAKKALAFSLLMKGFLFDKALMQEHFNENYAESDKYPKAVFNGNYTGDVNAAKDGSYQVQVKGQLTLHGVTKAVEAPAVVEMKDGKLNGRCSFKINPADYNIRIPAVVKDKIAKSIDVNVSISCNPK